MKKSKVFELCEPENLCEECGDEIYECDCPDCEGSPESISTYFDEGDNVYCMGKHMHFCKTCVDRIKKEKRRKRK